jgi:hypothetical protein
MLADFRLQERDTDSTSKKCAWKFKNKAEAVSVGKAPSEKEITEQFVALVSPRFELWPQVTMKHAFGMKLRIDFVGRERARKYPGWIGFELKRGAYDHFREFTLAVNQAIDYMHCAIQSDFVDADDVFNQQLRHAYVYPCPFCVRNFRCEQCDGIGDRWAQGVVRLAGRFGVGVITEEGELLLAGDPAYDIPTGRVRKLALVHQARNKFGSC